MAVTVAQLKVTIEADTGKLKSGLGEANKEVKGFGQSATKSAGDSGAAFLAFAQKMQIAVTVIKTATSAVLSLSKAASDLQESISKTNRVFGTNAAAVQKWAETTARALGISRNEALDAASSLGAMFSALKLTTDQSSKMSTNLVKLAADLASFYNRDPAEVIRGLQSAMRGEADAVDQFGIVINETMIKNEALKLGLIKTTKEAIEPATKAQAIYSLMLKQTNVAADDFRKTSTGLANQSRILKAEWEDLKTVLGQGVVPVVLEVVQVLRQGIEVVGLFSEAYQKDFLMIKTTTEQIGGVIIAIFKGIWTALSFMAVEGSKFILNGLANTVQATLNLWSNMPGVIGENAKKMADTFLGIRTGASIGFDVSAKNFANQIAGITGGGAKVPSLGTPKFTPQKAGAVDGGKKGGAGRSIEDQFRNLGVLDFFGEITKQFEDAMGLSAKTLSEMFDQANQRREEAARAMRRAIELLTKARNDRRNRSGNEEAYVYGRPSRAGEFGIMNGLDPNTDSEGFQRGRRGEGFKGQTSPMESFRLSFLRNSRSVGRRFLSDFLGDSRQRRQAFRGLFEDIKGAMIETLNQKGRDLIKPALDSIGKTLSDAIMQAAKAVHVSVGALLSAAYQLFSVMQRKKKFGLLSVVGGVAGAFLGGVGGALAGYNFGNALDNGDATGALFGAASAYAGGAFGGSSGGNPSVNALAGRSRAAGVNISIGQQIINDRADVARVSEEMAARVSRRVNSRVG